MRTGFIIITIAALWATPCFARIITVDDDGPADFNNIQAAIDDANSGDTVMVQPGTYTSNGNRDIDFLGKAITVKSENGPDNCIIDCQGTESQPRRGFIFQSSEDVNSILDGFTIQNGYGLEDPCTGWSWTLGGAIYCKSSGPTIKNCVIKNNEAVQGAGICALENSFITVTDCNISQNTTGCGIFLWENYSAIIKNCKISNNGRRGIGSWDSFYLNIFNCRITQNNLAGISCSDYNIKISNCDISDNSHGGISCCVYGDGNGLISNCLITKNSNSTLCGGGIRALTLTQYSDVLIKNCTITKNSAGYGGGISCDSGKVNLKNSIVRGNAASHDGNDIYVWQYPPPPGESFPPDTMVTIEYSNPGIVYASDVNIIWGPGNINVEPLFADILNDDYHLQSAAGRWNPNSEIWVQDSNTSTCIDASDPNADWTKELWPHGKRINMGAYGGTPEASMSLSTVGNIANLDNDPCDIIGINDLAVFVSKWCYEEYLLAEDLDRDGHVDFKDFAIFGNEPYEPNTSGQGLSYTISPCDMESSSKSITAEEIRFTVTINGHYIHFEDMMVGNCCTPLSNLWLEMEINSNLITIYEREELPQYPCWCICDYPVDANLGPFPAGTYTLVVYEDWGGFIGQAIVTIE